jgi:SAM-dependent methyltransferase
MAANGVHETVLGRVWEHKPNVRGINVLDAPCGQGPIAELLALKGAIVTGIDLAPPKTSDFGVTYSIEDLESCEIGEEKFDLVLSVEGIEHLHNPHAWITKISRCLKPNGIAIISTPNPDSLSSRWKAFSRGYYQYFDLAPNREEIFRGSGHIHPIYFSFLEWSFRRNGLEIIDVRTKSPRLPRFIERTLFSIFYNRFPPSIQPLMNGAVGIYTVKKSAS